MLRFFQPAELVSDALWLDFRPVPVLILPAASLTSLHPDALWLWMAKPAASAATIATRTGQIPSEALMRMPLRHFQENEASLQEGSPN